MTRRTRAVGGASAVIVALLIGSPLQASDRVDDYVARMMKAHNIPGLSLAVTRHGQVIKAAGYGVASLELRLPATPDTVYEIGSISKQFTAEAVMLLVEEGKVALDERISRYLDGLPASWSAITVRHLLTHTAGLKDWEPPEVGFSYRVDYTPAQFVALVGKYPLEFAPGERWAYTNSGFPLLGLIVERASGRSYAEFVTERIFKPLGLASTRFKEQGDIVPNRADGYMPDGERLHRGEPLRPRIIAPNGGILTTVRDMARWHAALVGGRVLKPASVAAMFTPVRLRDGQIVNHGFAWFMDSFNGHRKQLHPGTTVAGYAAVVYHFPDSALTVILLSNMNDGAYTVDAMARRIADLHVPGTSFSGLRERPDPEPSLTLALTRMLRELAEGRESALLAPPLRGGAVSTTLRETISSHLRTQTAFVFAGDEARKDQFVLDPTVARFRRYRMTTGGRTIYYTFWLTTDGQVARISTNEED